MPSSEHGGKYQSQLQRRTKEDAPSRWVKSVKVTPVTVARGWRESLKENTVGGVVADKWLHHSQMFSHANLSCRFYKHANENGALANSSSASTPLFGLLPPSPPACLTDTPLMREQAMTSDRPLLLQAPPFSPLNNLKTFLLRGAPRVTQEPFQCDKLLREFRDNSTLLSSFLPPPLRTTHKHRATAPLEPL